MSEHTVYTDPREPGAPQVGDLVVVVLFYENPVTLLDAQETSQVGQVCRIVDMHAGQHEEWRWHCDQDIGVVHAVRRPTEAELATWTLQEHGGRP